MKIFLKFLKNSKDLFRPNLSKNFRSLTTFSILILTIILLLITCFSMGRNEFSMIAQKNIFKVLYADIILLIFVAYFFSKKIYGLWQNRKSKGSQVQIKLIYIFTLISVIPSLFMIVFAGIFFHKGIDSWFNSRNEAVLIEASNVAEAYMKENIDVAKDDALGVARVIELTVMSESPSKISDRDYLRQVIESTMNEFFLLKNINAGIVTNARREILAISEKGISLGFIPILDKTFQDCLHSGGIIQIKSDDVTDVLLLVNLKIPFHDDAFLLFQKKIDEKIINHVNKTKLAYADYNDLKMDRFNLEVIFIIIFLIISFLLVLVAINFAIILSAQLIYPISNLIDSAEKIKNGDLNVRAKYINNSATELKLLSRTFNSMVSKVQSQQVRLENTNAQLDEKIQFISVVLSGVSSGVIGLDKNYEINLYNDVAILKIGKKLKKEVSIFDIFPQIEEYKQKLNKHLQVELQLDYIAELKHFIFVIKVVPILFRDNVSYIITVDDITNLTNAQRQAAWSDVARRVAHEIKNPLTPIQLAAERISRKYSGQIVSEKETFDKLINSIIKQVGDIKRLTDEFSFFARLPEPVFKKSNLFEILKQAVFFMQNAYQDINFKLTSTESLEKFEILVDERLIHQVFVNVLQNAVNAMKSQQITKEWVIDVKTTCDDNSIRVIFNDNGPGLPKANREKLTDPYFTLMPKGTGLGLAIVKKVMQDHDGKIIFEDGYLGGAMVTLYFSKKDGNLN